jgi:hypothetical protein
MPRLQRHSSQDGPGTARRDLYESDFYSWTKQQAGLMRSGELEALDLANLVEEIETLGRSEASALESACTSSS